MERYEITIAGLIDSRRARALGCEGLQILSTGDSLVVFAAEDQSGLYGLFARLRDAGLGLVAVSPVAATSTPARTGTTRRRSATSSRKGDK